MRACFGPTAQRLAVSALQGGLSDHLTLAGVSRGRLVTAAESLMASERLTSREMSVLAYAHGLTGSDTALVAFGGSYAKPLRPHRNRVERLARVSQGWWTEPTSRVADLGDAQLAKLIGVMVGVDLRTMSEDDPLPVPVDARFAALADRDLGAHWGLNHGILDAGWIEDLNQGHRAAAVEFLTSRPNRKELRDFEDDYDRYHVVNLPNLSVAEAAEVCGVDVCMIIATGPGKWRQLYCSVKDGKIRVSVIPLDNLWRECCRSIPDIRFSVSSLAEVGQELLRLAPAARWWSVVAQRFPVYRSQKSLESSTHKKAV